MRSKLRTFALAACAAVPLAASQCAPSRNADQPPAAASWTPGSSPDSIAAWAARGCRNADHRNDCLEQALTSVIRPAGVDNAMAALAVLADGDAEVANDAHIYAHGIGIAAYQSAETVTETLVRCTADFQSGCYHGTIQAYFADTRGGGAGVSAARLNRLCEPFRAPEKRWVQFQCAHGIGHGLMAVEAHDLPRALDWCDLIDERFEKNACWGGAFMENIVNVAQPHHTNVTRVADRGGQGRGNHDGPAEAGHEAHASRSHDRTGTAGDETSARPARGPAGIEHGRGERTFKALDPDDPLYPCGVVKEHHREACYLSQTSAILLRNNGDFRDAAQKCDTAPERYRSTCYLSLGRDATLWAWGNARDAIANCAAAPPTGQPHCIVGAVTNAVLVTADANDGLAFCGMVPDGNKPTCYHAIGQQIGLLHPAPPDRERVCRAADPGYVSECRRGAGLPLASSTASRSRSGSTDPSLRVR